MSASVEALAERARRHETRCGDGVMVWREWGRGAPVVLLHGGAGGWQHWVRTIPALMPACRVLAPDLPGLGDSALPAVPNSADCIADTVANGMATLLGAGVTCDLVGFSFGSVVAGHLTARHPRLVHSLTLVGPGGLGLQRGVTPLVKVRGLQGREREAAHSANLASLMIAEPARIDAQALRIQDDTTGRSRTVSPAISGTPILRRALERIRVPVGVIWGEHDAPARGDWPGRLALFDALQPAAPITIIPGAGHWVAYEAADAFNTALLGMLRRYGKLGPEEKSLAG